MKRISASWLGLHVSWFCWNYPGPNFWKLFTNGLRVFTNLWRLQITPRSVEYTHKWHLQIFVYVCKLTCKVHSLGIRMKWPWHQRYTNWWSTDIQTCKTSTQLNFLALTESDFVAEVTVVLLYQARPAFNRTVPTLTETHARVWHPGNNSWLHFSDQLKLRFDSKQNLKQGNPVGPGKGKRELFRGVVGHSNGVTSTAKFSSDLCFVAFSHQMRKTQFDSLGGVTECSRSSLLTNPHRNTLPIFCTFALCEKYIFAQRWNNQCNNVTSTGFLSEKNNDGFSWEFQFGFKALCWNIAGFRAHWQVSGCSAGGGLQCLAVFRHITAASSKPCCSVAGRKIHCPRLVRIMLELEA